MASNVTQHDGDDIALAGAVFMNEMVNLLVRKGIISNDEHLQLWRDAIAANQNGPSGNREGIDAVLRQVAPPAALR